MPIKLMSQPGTTRKPSNVTCTLARPSSNWSSMHWGPDGSWTTSWINSTMAVPQRALLIPGLDNGRSLLSHVDLPSRICYEYLRLPIVKMDWKFWCTESEESLEIRKEDLITTNEKAAKLGKVVLPQPDSLLLQVFDDCLMISHLHIFAALVHRTRVSSPTGRCQRPIVMQKICWIVVTRATGAPISCDSILHSLRCFSKTVQK